MGNFINFSIYEFKRNLKSTSFYFVAALFLFYQGIVFALFVALRQHPLSPPGPMFAPYFGGPFWFWPLLILVVTELSHDALSGEKSYGTIDILLASPLSYYQIAWAKFFASFWTYLLLWFATIPLVVFLMLHISNTNNILLAPIFTGYIGALLIGSFGISIGLFFSSLTEDTRLSGMLTFVTLFMMVLLKILINPAFGLISNPSLKSFISYVNFFDYMESFAFGKINWLNVTALLGGTVVFVTLAGIVIGAKQIKSKVLSLFDVFLLVILLIETAFILKNKDIDFTNRNKVDVNFISELKKLNKDVYVYIFAFPPSNTLYFHPLPFLENRLKLLSKISPRLKWKRVNVAKPGKKEEQLASEFKLDLEKIRHDPTGLIEGVLVIKQQDLYKKYKLADIFTVNMKSDKIQFNGMKLDSTLDSALNYFYYGGKNTVCVTMGHGELLKRTNIEYSPSFVDRALVYLKNQGYEIRFLPNLIKPVPSQCSLLFFASISSRLLDSEIENLKEYEYSQGNFLFMFDEKSHIPLQIINFLKNHGILLTDYRIADKNNAVNSKDGYIWVANFKEKNWNILLQLPRAIIAPNGKSLLQPSDNYMFFKFNSKYSLEKIKPTSKYKPSVATLVSSEYGGKFAVLGFIKPYKNIYLDKYGKSSDSADKFLLYVVEQLNGGNIDKIKPTRVLHHHLTLKSSEENNVRILGMIIMPLFAFAIGIQIAYRRKKKGYIFKKK